ncbi:interleukin-15 isoform X2 [Xenopus tropicalis]|uniref:Interleukin-15 isoform X2 n=1 Tax=Xenopus tropicalis TaxID=8364 RepID=A0A8J1J3S4_XENTR|nr:interleukin-15 isoform X2 [Xenopus tropicalis]
MDCTHDCTTHTAALSLGFQSSGRMVTTSEAVRVKAILDNINHIKKIFVEFNHANYEPSSLTLYTAQENDIRDACYNVILHCYFLEMRTVVEELTILKAEDTGELKLLHLLENLNISPTKQKQKGKRIYAIAFLGKNIESSYNLSSIQADKALDITSVLYIIILYCKYIAHTGILFKD